MDSPLHRLSSSSSIASPLTFSIPNPGNRRRGHRNLRKVPSTIKASWQEIAGVLVFSAIPFTAVKAIANSSIGQTLRRRLEETKDEAAESSKRFKAMAEKARQNRQNPKKIALPWGLGASDLYCKACDKNRFIGDALDYLGIPGLHIAGSQGVIVIAICQALLMVRPEYARYCGIEALEPLGIYLPGDTNYPGGVLFDPLGLSKDPVAFEYLNVKEIKNRRLAMVAWSGFYLQAALTGKGPIQNLIEHISDPYHNNVISLIKSM